MATLNLGASNRVQIRKNVEMVRRCRPFCPDEQLEVDEALAAKWGPRFGPVATSDSEVG